MVQPSAINLQAYILPGFPNTFCRIIDIMLFLCV